MLFSVSTTLMGQELFPIKNSHQFYSLVLQLLKAKEEKALPVLPKNLLKLYAQNLLVVVLKVSLAYRDNSKLWTTITIVHLINMNSTKQWKISVLALVILKSKLFSLTSTLIAVVLLNMMSLFVQFVDQWTLLVKELLLSASRSLTKITTAGSILMMSEVSTMQKNIPMLLLAKKPKIKLFKSFWQLLKLHIQQEIVKHQTML